MCWDKLVKHLVGLDRPGLGDNTVVNTVIMSVSACQVANRAALLACASPGTERLAEPKDGHQGFIDTPLLLRTYPAHDFT